MSINNDNRRVRADRFSKYVSAAKQLGIEVPEQHQNDLDAAVIWLCKQDPKVWQSIQNEAVRQFPLTFSQNLASA